MASKSSLPAPRPDSSAQSFSPARPRYLRVRHTENLREPEISSTAQAQNAVREDTDAAADSCNILAAEWLEQERKELGLTVEEAASVMNVSATTIWRRENALVDLGPLKQLVRLKRERALRRVK